MEIWNKLIVSERSPPLSSSVGHGVTSVRRSTDTAHAADEPKQAQTRPLTFTSDWRRLPSRSHLELVEMPPRHLPGEVWQIIAEQSDSAVIAALTSTCRRLFQICLPILYGAITLSSEKQMRSFIALAVKAANSERLQAILAHTRSFEIAAPADEASYMIPLLDSMPAHTYKAEMLFPRLTHASLLPFVPPLLRLSPHHGRSGTGYFLESVTHMRIRVMTGTQKPYSYEPSVTTPHSITRLGVSRLQSVFVTFESTVSTLSDLSAVLGVQTALQSVILDLRGHFDERPAGYAISRNMFDFLVRTYTAYIADIIIDLLNHYQESLRRIVIIIETGQQELQEGLERECAPLVDAFQDEAVERNMRPLRFHVVERDGFGQSGPYGQQRTPDFLQAGPSSTTGDTVLTEE